MQKQKKLSSKPKKVVIETSQYNQKRRIMPNPSQVTNIVTKEPRQPKTFMDWPWMLIKYLVIFVVIYTVINWWRQPVMPAEPQLQLIDYQGHLVDLDQLSHQSPVLVYFWGTWCGVCKVTSPTINALAQQHNYPIVTIAIHSGSDDELQRYMADYNYTFTTINDPNGEIFNQWQGQVTPSYVVLKNGEMTQGLTGIQPKWSLRLRLWLSALG